ncbi:hypothetical protein [[Mycobacterium] burgundiense]|uniref:Uncharacterized protein n=1 Tax=[Mycobacterium] burgundiense TaxID=3064286 RepID=A0ABM9LVZ0_9MYCO|nr:hypothetical protein [Mycolicibacterium sp. MU0053]CAJ1505664.1 hypothetical protein MU0053_002996 [Mycolicibacterium sp. MU0053]
MTDETTVVDSATDDDLAHEGDISDATPEGSDLESDPDGDPETFPRAYVEQLRSENAKYRQRAGEADSLANRLHVELVRATGRLADPTDLPFDAEHLEGDNLSLALDELLASKPHLAARRPTGDIGQGMSGPTTTVDLAAILRGKAG